MPSIPFAYPQVVYVVSRRFASSNSAFQQSARFLQRVRFPAAPPDEGPLILSGPFLDQLPCLGVWSDDSAAAYFAITKELIGLVGVIQREVFNKHPNLSGLREGNDID